MKAIFRKLISLSLAAALAAAPLTAYASYALGDDLDETDVTVNENTQLSTGTFWSNTYSDLRQESYVVYSPTDKVTPIVTGGAYSTQLTTVSAAAKALEAEGYRVVAGINGDYYDTAMGLPLGSVMTDGVLRNITGSNYAVGFYADGTTVMGKPELAITLVNGKGTELPVMALDYVRQSTYGIFLYDSEFNASHTMGTTEPGVDVICSVKEGRLSIGSELKLVVDEVRPEAKDTVVEKGKYVLTANLSAGGYAGALLAMTPGEELTIRVSANDQKWNNVENMIGALYQLVENGAVCSGLPSGAAPRTALGLRSDGALILYTIDGRQSGYSIGATLSQVAQRLIELGCVSAMSLDGGGSTTLMTTKPSDTAATLANKPSEGSLRAVTNHVFLVASPRASGVIDHIYLETEAKYVLPGAKVALSASAVDTNYIPMDTKLTYGADRGSVDGNVLTAPASGAVQVGARSGNIYATKTVEVISKPDSVSILQGGKAIGSLSVSRGATVNLGAKAVWNHLALFGDASCYRWKLDGNIGTISDSGVFTASDLRGSGTLTLMAGETSVTIPVTVTADPLRAVNGFEKTFDSYTGVNAMMSRSTNDTYVSRGKASGRLDYAIYEGEAAQISLSGSVPAGYDRLNFLVYGDGRGASLTVETNAGTVSAGKIDFTGWRQLSVLLPAGTTALTGLSLRAEKEFISAVYLDQFVLSYGGQIDTQAPQIKLSSADGTLKGTVTDDCDGTQLSLLQVTCDGVPLAHTYTNGALSAGLPARDGVQHRITVTAGDASGNLSRASIDLAAKDAVPAFHDTAEHWADSYINHLKASGVTTGNGNGNFNPDTNVSRQEFAVLLYRYLKPTQDFSDVKLPFDDAAGIADWALDGVRAMYAMGVTKGGINADGTLTFNPNAGISRQEAVTMMGRLLEKGYAVPEMTFRDRASIADWSAEYVAVFNGLGILTGDDSGAFDPTAPMSRAQVATVLYKML